MRQKFEVTDDEIEAATTAYFADESTEPFASKIGHTISLVKTIEMRPQAKKLLADKATETDLRRKMVKTAVILGFPIQR